MSVLRLTAVICLVAGMVLAQGKVRRDPLTDAETDQLRETKELPPQRIKLLVKFARTRLLAIDQLRSDPKLAEDRGQRIHDLLEDFTNIIDELGDNLDMYEDQKADLRKPLKEVIQAASEFQLKLRALKESSDPAAAREQKEYEFALLNAIDAVNANADDARSLLEKQSQEKQEKKKK